MKHTRTLILIADGHRARALMSEGPTSRLQEMPGFVLETALPPTRDLVTDRLPRAHDSVGHARHAMETRTDPHRELKVAFARKVADQLDKALAAKTFDRAVLVAPPTFLGDLRAALSDHVRAAVHGEVAKDLTHVPDPEVRQHLDIPV